MPKTILQYLNIAGFLWTLCISMFHISIPRWLLYGGIYLFVATWVIEIFVEKRWQQVKPDAQWIHYGALILLFCLGFIYAPWDGDVYFHHHAEQRIPLIAFGLIGIFGINRLFSKELIINTMVIASVCSVLFLFFITGWREVLFSPDRVFLIAEKRIQYINSHMGYNFFLNSTLIGMWYLLFQGERKPALWQKIAYPLTALLIFGMLMLSEGRSGFFIGLAIIGIMTVIEIYRWNKWTGIGVSIACLALMLALTASHPRVTNDQLTHDLRYAYWKSAIELIEEKPVFGYGMSRAQEEFDQVNMKYASEEERYFWTVLHHQFIDCHNQFIQSTLDFGIIGLLLVLIIYLSPLYICWGKREWWLAFFLTLISVGQSLFDVFLTRQFMIIYGLLFLMTMKMRDARD